jgi:hypothetical protein
MLHGDTDVDVDLPGSPRTQIRGQCAEATALRWTPDADGTAFRVDRGKHKAASEFDLTLLSTITQQMVSLTS